MPQKIATWNMCLGLFHKKDYVRTQLHKNNIDLLTLQKTKISPGFKSLKSKCCKTIVNKIDYKSKY